MRPRHNATFPAADPFYVGFVSGFGAIINKSPGDHVPLDKLAVSIDDSSPPSQIKQAKQHRKIDSYGNRERHANDNAATPGNRDKLHKRYSADGGKQMARSEGWRRSVHRTETFTGAWTSSRIELVKFSL
jgi:hypothetical protein